MRFQMNRMTTLKVYRIVTITPNEEMQKKKNHKLVNHHKNSNYTSSSFFCVKKIYLGTQIQIKKERKKRIKLNDDNWYD